MKKILTIVAACMTSSIFAAGPGGNQPGGGGGTPPGGDGNQPGGGSSATFAFDTFLATATTNTTKCILREGVWTGWASGITAATLASSVTNIAPGVCAGCTTLTSVDLSSCTSLTEIPDSAFAGCTALTTVTLPSTCTTIGANAFEGCTALATFTGAGVATVGADAFNGCSALSDIPSSATTLGAYSFAGTGIAALDLDGVSAGEGAFAGCESLATVSDMPTAVEDALFSGCTALELTDAQTLALSSVGAAGLAGIANEDLSLSPSVSLSDCALAAAEATVETTLAWDTDDVSEIASYADTAFLGRSLAASYTPEEGVVTRVEAAALVDWLASEASDADSTVEQPSSYATADLESWLATPANASSILAFCYAGQLAADEDFHPLDVDGTSFVWAAQDSGTEDAVSLTLEGSYALGDDEDWSSDILVWDDDAEAYVAEDADAEACFARLKIEKGW